MKRALLLSLFVWLLLSVPAAAQLNGYDVSIEVQSDGSADYLTTLMLTRPVGTFIFAIPGSPEKVNVSSPACHIDKALVQTNIICEFAGRSENLTISYTSAERRGHRDNYLVFADSFRIPTPAAQLSVRVKLPPGAMLKEPITDAMEPQGAEISTDGRQLLLSWSAVDVAQQFDVSIAYEQPGLSLLVTLAVFIAAVVIAGVVAWKFYFAKGKEAIKIILPVLKSDEKEVLKGLLKHGSGVNQKIIVKESGYSKAKVSKVLKSLAERGLVKLERTGRTNRIFWAKN